MGHKKVFLLGPEGSFSDIASQRLGSDFEKHYAKTFRDVFRAVSKGHYGFLPIRNSIIGHIRPAKELLGSSFTIAKRFRLLIHLCVMAKRLMPFAQIRFIYAAKAACLQCRKFFKANLPKAKFFLNFDSTSSAIKKIVQLTENRAYVSATIGSEKAAKIYGLKVLARNIQDSKNDWTEFVLFSV